MQRRSILFLAGRLLLTGAMLMTMTAVASAQERYVRAVRLQLNAFRTVLEERGYDKTHEYKIDSLGNRRSDSFTLSLQKGMRYVLVSVCDQDCSDIDVKVFDENNNEVGRDTEEDDKPIVEVTPRWTGQFRIRIEMFNCNRNPCYYGIGVFGK